MSTWDSRHTRDAATGVSSLRLLFLSEGDPENPVASGSGTPASVIEQLRATGTRVVAADVDLTGPARALAAMLTFARQRQVWQARYHIAPIALRLRSRNAAAAATKHRRSIDAVLQYGGTFDIGRSADVPYFLFCDNNIRNSMEQPRSWAARVSRRELNAALAWEESLYANALGIFAFSDFVRRSFVRDYALDAERVVVVGSGPNLPLERIPAARVERSRETPPTILFVGRDFEHKGGPVMLEAFRIVRQRIPDARLLLVGPSSFSQNIPGVEYAGFLRKDDSHEFARLLEAYAAADVFCLPTRYESFGIAFVEAMWFGLPVIAPRQWAIPEIVADGRTGYLIEREDPKQYASRLIELLEDPSRAHAMGLQGRIKAESQFTWERVTALMSDVMRSLLATPRRAGG